MLSNKIAKKTVNFVINYKTLSAKANKQYEFPIHWAKFYEMSRNHLAKIDKNLANVKVLATERYTSDTKHLSESY